MCTHISGSDIHVHVLDVMIPFLSMSGTGSHITRMAVEELVMACTLSGGAFGTRELENLCT